MNFNLSSKIYNVNQRATINYEGKLYWRISLSADAPLVIERSEIFGLAMQLDLNHAEITTVLGTDAFPPKLVVPGKSVSVEQWLYKPAVAALIALAEAKRTALLK